MVAPLPHGPRPMVVSITTVVHGPAVNLFDWTATAAELAWTLQRFGRRVPHRDREVFIFTKELLPGTM